MQVTSRVLLHVTAGSAACALLAGVLGMSRSDAESLPRLAVHGARPAAAELPPYPDPRPAPVNARLLPNLRSLPAEDVGIRVEDGQRQLWFTSIIANAGLGPAEVVPDGVRPCPAGQRHASQVLYHDAGGNGYYEPAVDRFASRRTGGCMLDHPEHDHWHFDAMARYTLTSAGRQSPVVGSNKVSFCLRDNRETPAASPVKLPKRYGDCGRDKVQGIMPGWADVYDTDLPDQHLVLPADLPDGNYCLRSEADPLQLLLETDDADNAAVRPVRISGSTVAAGPPASCG
ncbi:MAG: hypothetical protein ICV70_06590 [Jiangellaceae bacterium]|nr:hypothetical protein [Jiangellaceae bacterium]